MSDGFVAVIMFIMTIVIYFPLAALHRRIGASFTVPVLTSTILIVLLLSVFDLSYDTYMRGGKWIHELLGPAVVSLAYPLYQQRHVLKKLIIPIVFGTFAGAVIGISTGVLLAKWAGFGELMLYTIAPKSVTTPVAMVIAESVGGVMPLAAVFVMIAGIGGAIIGPTVFKLLNINHDLGRGVGMGSASHAIGTAAAMERGAREGSASTIAMVVSAVMVSVLTPGLVGLFV